MINFFYIEDNLYSKFGQINLFLFFKKENGSMLGYRKIIINIIQLFTSVTRNLYWI